MTMMAVTVMLLKHVMMRQHVTSVTKVTVHMQMQDITVMVLLQMDII
jgi:hypothetical protein